MTEGSFVPLPGSQRETISGVQDIGPVNPVERIEVTLIIRRRAELPAELVIRQATVSTEELASTYGADPADIDHVREILAGYGLEVTGTHPGSRRVNVAGTAAQLTRAFGTTLRRVSSPDPAGSGQVEHRYREGRLLVPAGLEGIVLAVLGLDDRPQASPHFRASVEAATPSSYTPPQVARAYRFPEGTDGTGQTIAVLEFGGGFSASDLQSYFSGLGLTVPSVTAARVNGASNAPGEDPNGADGEVLLDIEVAGAVAPGAAQVVYFAPNTDQAAPARDTPTRRPRPNQRGDRHTNVRVRDHRQMAHQTDPHEDGRDQPGRGCRTRARRRSRLETALAHPQAAAAH